MAQIGEMTRYAFISHLEDYMKQLLKNPLKADTDDFLKHYGIDGKSAIKMLMKRSNPDDEMSSVIIRTEKIRDNGYDDDGKRKKDSFVITYKIPRKDYSKKMRNLYISLFESNIVDNNSLLEEGAWGYGILDNDSALDAQDKFSKQCLNVLMSKLNQPQIGQSFQDTNDLWANLGVLIDFLKKYKDDEIQFDDEYNTAVELAKTKLQTLLTNENFLNSWSEPKTMRSKLKKLYKEVSMLRYQKEIMNIDDPNKIDPTPTNIGSRLNEDECAGSTTCDASNGQYGTKMNGKNGGTDVIRKQVHLYLTQEQVEYIKEATAGSGVGDIAYDASAFDTTSKEGRKFMGDTLDHTGIIDSGRKE